MPPKTDSKCALEAMLVAIDRYGMEPPEFQVLMTMWVDYCVEGREHIVSLAALESEGGLMGSYPDRVYRRALGKCIKKGWLAIVDGHRHAADVKERSRETIPSCDHRFTRIGGIDYTQVGYVICRDLRRRLFGETRTGEITDHRQHSIDVYSEDTPSCIRRAEYLSKIEGLFVKRGARSREVAEATFLEFQGPFEVGPWRYTRFEVLSCGTRIKVRFGWPPRT